MVGRATNTVFLDSGVVNSAPNSGGVGRGAGVVHTNIATISHDLARAAAVEANLVKSWIDVDHSRTRTHTEES